jgi:hypothetical protein
MRGLSNLLEILLKSLFTMLHMYRFFPPLQTQAYKIVMYQLSIREAYA